MKIQINAEINGKELVEEYIIPTLAVSKITAETKEIRAQVVNKAGDWVDFDAEKIKFIYGKV